MGTTLAVLCAVIVALALGGLAFISTRTIRRRCDAEAALALAREIAFEDVTAFGEDLTKLDSEIVGKQLDEGATAEYRSALDAYEAAKIAGESLTKPDDVQVLTGIIEDGRYIIASVRAMVAGEPLPTRRGRCFFDPRHGPSVADVRYTPEDGVERQVPACASDLERIKSPADPDRKIPVGGTYWEDGQSYLQ